MQNSDAEKQDNDPIIEDYIEGARASIIELMIIKGLYDETIKQIKSIRDLFKIIEYKCILSVFSMFLYKISGRENDFKDELKRFAIYQKDGNKPVNINWDFSDLLPTLEHHLSEEDMEIILSIIGVLLGSRNAAELEKLIKIEA